jgi:hypothetical protein
MMDQCLRRRIDELYGELPEVACHCCGCCCVSPTCTLAEFIYLVAGATEILGASETTRRLTVPPRLHPAFDGNTLCPFLDAGRCAIHDARTGACRLFGIPSLTHLNIEEMEECRHGIDIVNGRGDISFVREWLSRLVALNQDLHPFESEPYFIRGLNLHCWLDICVDELFDFDIFADIRARLHDNLDLSTLANRYTPSTGLREKIDKITILSSMLGSGDRAALRAILHSILHDYPLTGTYFYDEGREMLAIVDDA